MVSIIKAVTDTIKVIPDFESKKLLLYSYDHTNRRVLKPLITINRNLLSHVMLEKSYKKYYDMYPEQGIKLQQPQKNDLYTIYDNRLN